MTPVDDDFGFVSMSDLNKEKDEYGFVPFNPVKDEQVESPSQDYEENDLERDIERQQARMTSQAISAIFGLPGDIEEGISTLTGYKSPLPFPTSEKIQKKMQSFGQGYLDPKNDIEKEGDQLIKDFTVLAMPGANAYGFFRNLGLPIAGYATKKGLESTGAEEGTADTAKYGLMLATDLLLNRRAAGGGAGAYAGQLFRNFEEQMQNGGYVNARPLMQSINNLRQQLGRGGSRPSTGPALTKIDELEDLITRGPVDVRELYPFRSAINEIIDSVKGFEINPSRRRVQQRTIDRLNDVKDAVIESVEDWAQQNNPEALQTWREANEAYRVNEQSRTVSQYIYKTAKNFLKDPLIRGLFGGGIGAGGYTAPGLLLKGSAITAGASLPVYAGIKAGELLYRVVQSPVLRRYYGNIIRASTENNAPLLVSNLKRLKAGLHEIESDSQSENAKQNNL